MTKKIFNTALERILRVVLSLIFLRDYVDFTVRQIVLVEESDLPPAMKKVYKDLYMAVDLEIPVYLIGSWRPDKQPGNK